MKVGERKSKGQVHVYHASLTRTKKATKKINEWKRKLTSGKGTQKLSPKKVSALFLMFPSLTQKHEQA
jgi:hypothetical protein